jgi:hypothetical protein
VLDDVNRVVRVADDGHTAVEHSRHTVRNLTIAGLVPPASDDASDAGLRFYASGLGRGRERGVIALVLVGVGLAEVGDRVVELG